MSPSSIWETRYNPKPKIFKPIPALIAAAAIIAFFCFDLFFLIQAGFWSFEGSREADGGKIRPQIQIFVTLKMNFWVAEVKGQLTWTRSYKKFQRRIWTLSRIWPIREAKIGHMTEMIGQIQE